MVWVFKSSLERNVGIYRRMSFQKKVFSCSYKNNTGKFEWNRKKALASPFVESPILETWPNAHASQFNVLPKSYMVLCTRLECKDCTKTYIHIVPCIVWCGRLVNVYKRKMKTNSYCIKFHLRLRWIETIKREMKFDLHKMKTKLHVREIIRNTSAMRCLKHF